MRIRRLAYWILAGLSLTATLALAQSDTPGGVPAAAPAATRDISGIKPGTATPTPKHKTKHKKTKPAASNPAPAK